MSCFARMSEEIGFLKHQWSLLTMVSSFPWDFLNALVHLVLRGLRFLLNALWHFDRQNLKICGDTETDEQCYQLDADMYCARTHSSNMREPVLTQICDYVFVLHQQLRTWYPNQ